MGQYYDVTDGQSHGCNACSNDCSIHYYAVMYWFHSKPNVLHDFDSFLGHIEHSFELHRICQCHEICPPLFFQCVTLCYRRTGVIIVCSHIYYEYVHSYKNYKMRRAFLLCQGKLGIGIALCTQMTQNEIFPHIPRLHRFPLSSQRLVHLFTVEVDIPSR